MSLAAVGVVLLLGALLVQGTGPAREMRVEKPARSGDGRVVYAVGADDRAPFADHRSCQDAHLPASRRCSLRTALARAQTLGRPVEIRLPANVIQRKVDAPLTVAGDVRVVGGGPLSTTLDAAGMGPVFVVERGSTLRLKGLTAIGGNRRANDAPSAGRVTMDQVTTSARALPPGLDLAQVQAFCSLGLSASQYYRRADIVDPDALAVVPGSPF